MHNKIFKKQPPPHFKIDFTNVKKPKKFTHTIDKNVSTFSFTYLSKNKNWVLVTLKGINFFYALWAACVFALMSFFRANGKDDFKNLNEDDVLKGLFYAFCSLIMNVPMGYFFSYKMVVFGKTVFSEKVFSRNGDWLLGISFILGTVLGGLTTFAGIAVALLSLQKWAPFGFSLPTAGIFAINTFTTRAYSTSYMIYEFSLGLRYTLKTLLYLTCRKETPLFKLLNDMYRFKDEIRWLKVSKERGRDPISKYQQAIGAFYTELEERELSPTRSYKEWLSRGVKIIASVSMGILWWGPMALWLNLTQGGLNVISSDLAKNKEMVWLSSLSNNGLYIRSGLKIPEVPSMLYNRPGMQEHPWYSKLLIIVAFLTPIFLFGYFSGTGYAEVAKDEEEKGNGSVVEELLESDFFLEYLYQLLYVLLVYILNIWTTCYYPVVAGGVNAKGAIDGLFAYLPEPAKKKIPALFSEGKPKGNDNYEYPPLSELIEFAEAVDRNLVPDGLDQPLDEEDWNELNNTIATHRKEWAPDEESLSGGSSFWRNPTKNETKPLLEMNTIYSGKNTRRKTKEKEERKTYTIS